MATTRKRKAKRGTSTGATRKKGTRKSGAKRKKGGAKKGARTIAARVSKLEKFHAAQRKWNANMETSVRHIYTETKISRPKALGRLPRV